MTYEFYHIVEFWREWTHQPILRQDRKKRWNTPCILANIGTLPWCLRKTMASAPFPEQHVKGWQHNVVSCWWGWDHATQTIFQQISFQFKQTKKYVKKLPLSTILPCWYPVAHTATKLIAPLQQHWVFVRSLDFWLLIPCQSWRCFEASLIEGSPFNCFIKVFTKEFDQKTFFQNGF